MVFPCFLFMPNSNSHTQSCIQRLSMICIMGCIFHVLIAGIYSITPQSDALDYHEHALRLANTHAFTVQDTPTAYRPIGFPALLSIAYMIAPSILAGFMLQSLLISITALCIGITLHHYGISEKKALIASGVYLLIPMTWVQSMTLMSEPLAICAMMLSIVVRLKYQTTLSRGVEGLLWGIAILTRPIMLFCVIGIAVHDIIKKSRPFAHTALFLSCMILSLLPWMIRNAQIFGSPIIATNTGINLYIGNNAHANGSYKVIPEMKIVDSLPEMEANTLALSKAIDYIQQYPLQAFALLPKKVAYLCSSDAYLPLQLFHIEASSYPERLLQLPLWSIILIIPGYVLMYSGVSHASIFRSSQYSLFLVILLCLILPCMIFFGSARYHEPMIPLLLIAAVIGYEKGESLIGPSKILPIALVLLWMIEFSMVFLHM